MALASYAWGYDGGTYNGKDMRQLVEAVFPAPASGVVTGLGVTQQASPTSTVSVAAGKAIVQATGSGLTGTYHAWNDAALTSPTIDPTTTNGRKDRLILRVSSGVPALEVVKGTAAASPAEPSITGDNYLELALITLPSSTSNITNAMITDRRVYASAAGSVVTCTSTTRPTVTRPGSAIFETDANLLRVRDATNASWVAQGNIIVCTSSTRPSPTAEGVLIYETDTDRLFTYDGSVWRHRTPMGASVTTSQSTTSTTFTDLATSGPAVTINTGTSVAVTVAAQITSSDVNGYTFMSYGVTGATTSTATDGRGLGFIHSVGTFGHNLAFTYVHTGLTAGTNTFTAKYRVTAGTGTFANRSIVVQNL